MGEGRRFGRSCEAGYRRGIQAGLKYSAGVMGNVMSEAPADAVQLIAGLITHMKQIVGDGACYAMLHYGAMEEGKRFGASVPDGELKGILQRIDAVMMHSSEVVQDDGSTVTIRVHSSAFLPTGQRALHGIILGLVEGALTSARNSRYKGNVVQPGAPGEILLELRKEG